MIKPLHDRLYIQVLPRRDVSTGGIHVVDDADRRPNRCRVLAIGPDVTGLDVGDVVVVGRFAGVTVDSDGAGTRYLVRQEEVLALDTRETDAEVMVTVDVDHYFRAPLFDAAVDVANEAFVAGVLGDDGPDAEFIAHARRAGLATVTVYKGGDVAYAIKGADTTKMFGEDGQFSARKPVA